MPDHIMIRWMEIHNKTVDDLAEVAGCTPSHIRNLLAGRKNASLSLAKRLHTYTDRIVPVDAFLMQDEKADP